MNFVEDEELKIVQPGGDIKTFIANLEIIECLDDDGEPIKMPPAITNYTEIQFLNENFVCVSQNCQKFLNDFECPVLGCKKQF